MIPPRRGSFGPRERSPRAIVTAQAAGAPPYGVLAVEMPAHEHAEACAAAAAALLVDLQQHAGEAHGIVPGDHAFLFVTQDLGEIVPADRDEGTGGIGGRVSEGGVVVRDEVLAQIAVSRGHGADPRHPQLVDQTPLQRAVRPFAPPARLGGEAHDVLDAAWPGRARLA